MPRAEQRQSHPLELTAENRSGLEGGLGTSKSDLFFDTCCSTASTARQLSCQDGDHWRNTEPWGVQTSDELIVSCLVRLQGTLPLQTGDWKTGAQEHPSYTHRPERTIQRQSCNAS